MRVGCNGTRRERANLASRIVITPTVRSTSSRRRPIASLTRMPVAASNPKSVLCVAAQRRDHRGARDRYSSTLSIAVVVNVRWVVMRGPNTERSRVQLNVTVTTPWSLYPSGCWPTPSVSMSVRGDDAHRDHCASPSESMMVFWAMSRAGSGSRRWLAARAASLAARSTGSDIIPRRPAYSANSIRGSTTNGTRNSNSMLITPPSRRPRPLRPLLFRLPTRPACRLRAGLRLTGWFMCRLGVGSCATCRWRSFRCGSWRRGTRPGHGR